MSETPSHNPSYAAAMDELEAATDGYKDLEQTYRSAMNSGLEIPNIENNLHNAKIRFARALDKANLALSTYVQEWKESHSDETALQQDEVFAQAFQFFNLCIQLFNELIVKAHLGRWELQGRQTSMFECVLKETFVLQRRTAQMLEVQAQASG